MIPAAPPSSYRATSVTLGACAVLMLLVMLHHPVAGRGEDLATAIMAIARFSGLVHGSLIVLLLIVLHALQRTTDPLRALGLDPRAGLLALTVSVAAFVTAASLNGFVVPQVAAEAHAMAEAQRAAFPLILETLEHASRQCVVLATLSLGTAQLLWSVPLLVRRGPARWPAIVGTLAGTTLVAAMLTGDGQVHVTGMTLIVAGFGLWLVSLAAWLWHPSAPASAACAAVRRLLPATRGVAAGASRRSRTAVTPSPTDARGRLPRSAAAAAGARAQCH